MDDKLKKVSADQSRININESYEIDYWYSKFGLSKDKLRATVLRIGSALGDGKNI